VQVTPLALAEHGDRASAPGPSLNPGGGAGEDLEAGAEVGQPARGDEPASWIFEEWAGQRRPGRAPPVADHEHALSPVGRLAERRDRSAGYDAHLARTLVLTQERPERPERRAGRREHPRHAARTSAM
jgi:hypothetical protein